MPVYGLIKEALAWCGTYLGPVQYQGASIAFWWRS